MNTIHSAAPSRTGRRLVGMLALLVSLSALGACSATGPDLDSIGLDLETDIQAGTRGEFGFPKQAGTAVSVVSAPAGVTAAVVESSEDGMQLLSVNVHADTPRGAYNLGISVVRDGAETVIPWPFDVTD